ncbi:uncharacterized protein LOC101847809 [Aplysia californica]|uniref:Uncharacterized protein LOC101847809 n=1 Tax=Aplysia californica TaxID=6500 RepID=A0ABM0JJA9_APLCA|nr:uncharacterized protein LOC101847809 [Aplysia californica]
MCFGIGLGCCIEILPYLCLVCVPILGSFCGVETIYRLAIYLMLHGVLVECIPKILFSVIPVLNLLLLGLLMYLPVSLTPWPVIWLFDKLIWASNPVFMISEVVLVQNFVMRRSQLAADQIEQDDDSAVAYKAAILLFSSLCYAVAASLAYHIYTHATGSQILCLFVTLSILIAIHNMMWMAHEGIISDCAFCSLVSITVLYIMVFETQQISSPLPEPLIWKKTSFTRSSFVSIIYWILNVSSANAQRSILYLHRFFSPFFLGLLAVRLWSILFIANKMTRNFFTDRGNGESEDMETVIQDFDERDKNPWRSPLLLKLSIIFMLSQFTANFVLEWSGHDTSFSWLSAVTKRVWPSEVLIGRMMQILCVNCFYTWRLYRAEDWTWNSWLTP